jgi:hypothetical protein
MYEYTKLNEAIHPDTKELYRVGDLVCIYQGRFGHDNIWTIGSMFKTNQSDYIYVSRMVYSDEDYKKVFPNNVTGTYLNSVKYKVSDKDFKKINKAKQLLQKHNQY